MRSIIEKTRTAAELYEIRRTLPLQVLLAKLKLEYHDYRLSDVNLLGTETGRCALVTHLVQPFLLSERSYLFKKHPVNWQPLQLVRSVNEYGFTADVYGKERAQTLETPSKYDLLFGTNPHFFSFAEQMPTDTPCIYYNGGMHWEFQNDAVEDRLDRLEERRGVRLDDARTADAASDFQHADHLVIIGTDYNRRLYRERMNVDLPIHTITNAGFDELNVLSTGCGVTKQTPECLTNFLWLAGSGPVLKGLDLALDVFADLPELDLYVCGPIGQNEAFEEVYWTELYETDNIHTLGWVDLFSPEFERLAKNCGFHLFPSCSESISVAVINSMHRGVVPITTRESGIDVGSFGYTVEPTVDDISETVREVTKLSETDLLDRSRMAAEQARTKYSKAQFRRELSDTLGTILTEDVASRVP